MGEFNTDWLALREPVDARARDPGLTQQLVAWRRQFQHLNIIDLGTGTGANPRFLTPHLGARQHWLLLDHDPDLLARIEPRMRSWADAAGMNIVSEHDSLVVQDAKNHWRLERREVDLATTIAELEWPNVQLVTASALLDLVSRQWFDAFADRCRAAQAAVFIALTYAGIFDWEPTDRDDALIVDLFNAHQRTQKSFGLALGPDAADYAVACLQKLGYRTQTARSDWRLTAADAELQKLLLTGCAAAAQTLESAAAERITAWLNRRLAVSKEPSARLTVGHVDLFARL